MIKKKLFLSISALVFLIFFCSTYACPICHTEVGSAVRAGLFNKNFIFILSVITSIFLIFILIIMSISYLLAHKVKQNALLSSDNYNFYKKTQYVLMAGMLFGGGMAGFLDGILFHQILQAHSMISNVLPLNSLINEKINMFWDGIFHAHVFLIILMALVLLTYNIKYFYHDHIKLVFVNSIFAGFGTFNLIEGIIDHHIFKLHYVIQSHSHVVAIYSNLIFILIAGVMAFIPMLYLHKKLNSL